MTIDVDGILDKYILIARSVLSSELSQTGPVGSEFPSVIRARQNAPKPDYPYCVIDLLDIQQEDGWLTHTEVDNNDQSVYETVYQLLINFIIYGGNALSISNKLEGYFRLPNILDDIRNITSGSLVLTQPINSIPIQLSTGEWLESSSFQLIHNTVDTLTDTVSGDTTIDTVTLDGELVRDESETNYLDIAVSVTKP